MITVQKVQGVLIPWDEDSQEAMDSLPVGQPIQITVKKGTATNQQRKALFVWCGKLAKAFNEGGITRCVTIGGIDFDTDWCKDTVYKDIWCQVQKAIVGTDSVRTLEKQQLDDVYNIINRDIMAAQGIRNIPFPQWQDLAT